MRRTYKNNLQPSSRSGFTLIELMVVIVIIAILMALILPAIGAVRRRAAIADTSAELSKLDSAIATCSSAAGLGVLPWSEIVLTEDPSSTAWTPDSMTKLRRMFPQMVFTTTNDINGDGDTNDVLTLTGSECLVFFLAGIPSRDTDGNGTIDATEAALPPTMTGFSKNPVNPFVRGSSNQLGPYFTFDVGRFVDIDGDGMVEYLDSLSGQQTPLHFASSNNGQGYSSVAAHYVQTDGKTPWNKDGVQIISPGFDGEFGFVPTSGQKGPFGPGLDLTGARVSEADNIANFNPGGTLGN